ncbi:hypothetical protein [Rhodococcus sp. HNM0569]|uniref:lipase family alpha/beta hydrolase n=1 Tax=Rhodococcus sp. HNM0569 TaxID=2716340 RepID=UPI00146D8BAE|nr:hypothetical protein [Rhodococcus sp. HNM0569]NLU85089.1 alpha/beta hydrolase [Rhodococcus sp. HNM0569]
MGLRHIGVVGALVTAVALWPAAASAAPGSGSVDAPALPAGEGIAPPVECASGSRPVVVLPGADGTVTETDAQWSTMVAALRDTGYCALVFQGGVVDGKRWAGAIPDEAAQVAEFVATVRASTGAETVDLVAHSAGTVVSNYYLKKLGGADTVGHAVFLAPEGRDCDGVGFLGEFGISDPPVTPVEVLRTAPFLPPLLGHLSPDLAVAMQLVPGSPVYEEIFGTGPVAQPGVAYSILATEEDELATPAPTCSFLDEPGVTNTLFEQAYPGSPAVDHSSLRSSPDAAEWVVEQLGRP